MKSPLIMVKTVTQSALSQRQLHVGKPAWMKTNITGGANYFQVKRNLKSRKLVTVCEEAKCPNIGECWNSLTATFMVLGDTCTRACRFCHIKTGNPQGWLNPHEPQEVAASAHDMNLSYVVLTMVDRDDLDDGGAGHVAQVIRAIQSMNPEMSIEILAGDFAGDLEAIATIMNLGVCVYAHNLETVERLSPRVRDRRASYQVSLNILRRANELKHTKKQRPNTILTKSAIMVGLGESHDEVYKTMQDLRSVGCDLLTIGQYMRPTKKHLAIKSWVAPDVFQEYEHMARELKFRAVLCKPLARSSYRARDLYHQALEL
ncbi:MAG: lipoyl synthase [Proteobacteria bacterium]|nr:lipoyl synthase [Pseudomonadota bacterium]